MGASVKQREGAAKVTTPGSREIRTERVFDAPRDRVWRAFTEPKLVAQWWGRGHALDVESLEVRRGGRWRFVERDGDQAWAFEGRFREVKPMERIVQSFEFDGMPGHVAINDAVFEELGEGRTRVITTVLFHTSEERDGMLSSGMADGLNESYAALDRVLEREAMG